MWQEKSGSITCRGDKYHSLGYPKRDLGERTVLEIIHLERTLEVERRELLRKEMAVMIFLLLKALGTQS